MKRLLPLFPLALTLLLGTAKAAPALAVRDAWVPEAPPVTTVQAAYLELVNEGSSAVVVTAVASPDFGTVEMHRTVQVEGAARMERLPELRVEPGGTLPLAPGGLHLMLIGPKRQLVAGDRVAIELRLQDGSAVIATAEVRRPGGDMAGEHAHHHH
jgi:hypothetical protein